MPKQSSRECNSDKRTAETGSYRRNKIICCISVRFQNSKITSFSFQNLYPSCKKQTFHTDVPAMQAICSLQDSTTKNRHETKVVRFFGSCATSVDRSTRHETQILTQRFSIAI